MTSKLPSPTPYPDVNALLLRLLADVQAILEDRFTGMYLFGSLAGGDFDEDSDIDVLILTAGEIDEDHFAALKGMHQRIAAIDSPWAIQLEVSYIPVEAIAGHDPNNATHPHIDRGPGEELHMMRHHTDWIIQRHTLRERGVVVAGPAIRPLIDPVSPDDLRQASVDLVPIWLAGFLDSPEQMDTRGYQSYIVLTLCRLLYTLHTGEVVSKRRAMIWAKEHLDPQWVPLIDGAWYGRHHHYLPLDPADVAETQNMIRYTINQCRQMGHLPDGA